MAEYLGVYCDYLVELSDIREDRITKLTANKLELTDDIKAILQDFMLQLESPLTGKVYVSKEENTETVS